ncbi:uncharacterized protein LOC103524116 [Trichonephila clavipes]|nr:uncharacterized protein LOC103524116 [Trichonephila clavipes]
MAFRVINDTPGRNIVIFIDSQATIKTIPGYNLFPSKLEFECKQLINSFLCTIRKVILQWIPSHCGIHVNEQADKLVKEASTLHPPCLPMPLRNAMQLLRDKLRQKRISTLTDLAVGKSWSCLLDGQRRAQLSALPRVWHVSESSTNMITLVQQPMRAKAYWAHLNIRDNEVHEQIFQSGGQSDAKTPVLVSKQTWYSFIDPLKDRKASQPCPVRDLNPGPVA